MHALIFINFISITSNSKDSNPFVDFRMALENLKVRYHVVNVLVQFCALTIISGWVYHYAHIFYFVGKVFLCLTKQKYKNNMIYKDNKYEPSKRYTNNIISLEF